MKNLKFIYLSIVIAIFALVSCDNNEAIIDVGNPNQSESAKIAMAELQNHFDVNTGSLNGDNNPTGNILFDYCFDFEYPVTLSYNTGTTVTINEFNDLVKLDSNSQPTGEGHIYRGDSSVMNTYKA